MASIVTHLTAAVLQAIDRGRPVLREEVEFLLRAVSEKPGVNIQVFDSLMRILIHMAKGASAGEFAPRGRAFEDDVEAGEDAADLGRWVGEGDTRIFEASGLQGMDLHSVGAPVLRCVAIFSN